MMVWHQVPGAAVTVTTPDGTWATVHGVADLEAEYPLVDDMAWSLHSLTKSVVVAVLLQLAGEGELRPAVRIAERRGWNALICH